MALVKCHECGKEISIEAKICPSCGAKNKKHKAKVPTWIVVVVFGGIAWFLYYSFSYIENPGSFLPNCVSAEARENFKKIVDDSQYAQKNKLRVVDVTELREISAGSRPQDQVCEASFLLNNGEKVTYIFNYVPKTGELGFLIHAKPKK